MKTKITGIIMLLGASLLLTTGFANAQNTSPYWSVAGNSNATASSKLGTTNNIPLRLFTLNAERIHVNADITGKVGYVGIGTTAPSTRLHVNGVVTATGGTSTNWNLAYTRVPAGASNKVPRWNGTSYIAGSITDNATNVAIGGAVNTNYRLNVLGSSTLGGISVTDPVDNNILYCSKSGINYGIFIEKTSPSSGTACIGGFNYGNGPGLEGYSNSGNGVYGNSNTGRGVYGNGVYGVHGNGTSYGVYGSSPNNYGVYATSGYLAVYGSGTNYGLYGSSTNGNGVYASSSNNRAIQTYSTNNTGGWFESGGGNAVWGKTGGTVANAVYAGVFEGGGYTYVGYYSSDRILKKNIQDVGNAMNIINQLKPKHYEFRDDGEFAALNLPKGNHYGLIAQELEEVLPELVAMAPKGLGAPATIPKDAGDPAQRDVTEQITNTEIAATKAINYTELIPIIIKAMQEQQKEITDLKAENQQMKNDMLHCCLNHSTGSLNNKLQQSSNEKASLEQNAPNPFTEQTIIRYYLPAGSVAVLKVMSMDGKEMLSTAVTQTGYGELTISARTLAAGTYTYTLIVNGKAIESRIMVLSA